MQQQPIQSPTPYQPAQTHGQWAIAQANKASDYIVLGVTFAILFLGSAAYFIISYVREVNGAHVVYDQFGNATSGAAEGVTIWGLLGTFIGGAIAFAVILLLGMFLVRMQRQTTLGNSLQVEYSDYAWLRDWANKVAVDLNMPRVEIFVTQDPVINAYAFGFARPYVIVLHSGSIRYLTHEELKVVVVHEMAHIKYKHTNANVYLVPFLSLPIINIVGRWIVGFWSRRAEWTADRLALMYLGDSELVKKSLIKVHVGPDVAKDMNDTARQWLEYTAERPMNHLAQTFSTHPFLVRRLSQIDKYKYIVEPPAAPTNATIETHAATPQTTHHTPHQH